MLLNTLIDKKDNFQLIGEKIAEILLLERDNQKELAEAAEKDPELWHYRVFHEASSPVEDFQDEAGDKSPVVNVWFENNEVDWKASNVVNKKAVDGIYNIDCYGYGISTETMEGHLPSDKASALESQRIACLIRNIIDSNVNVWLDMKGVVSQRKTMGISMFQPQRINGEPMEHVVGARLRLEVRHVEYAVQMAPEEISEISINVRRKGTGEIYINSMYDYSN